MGQLRLGGPLAYLAVAVATAWLPVPWPLRRLNYATVIVLYAYPVEQACIALGGVDQPLWATILYALPVTLLLAAASWHLVERPLLRRLREAPVVWVGGTAPLPLTRPIGWYAGRVRQAIPMLLLVLAYAAATLAVMAMTMFALQRDQPGM